MTLLWTILETATIVGLTVFVIGCVVGQHLKERRERDTIPVGGTPIYAELRHEYAAAIRDLPEAGAR